MNELNWNERFSQTIEKYNSCKTEASEYWSKRVTAGGGNDLPTLKKVIDATWPARYAAYVEDLERIVSHLGSPIEKAMLCSLVVSGYSMAQSVRVSLRDRKGITHELIDGSKGPAVLHIEAQKQIGPYRLDFFLSYSEHNLFGNDLRTATNELAIECDGHEFHDRTREQASGDRKRDRALQAKGIQVFRFTGSDIWRDSYACAKEALDCISARPSLKYGPLALGAKFLS